MRIEYIVESPDPANLKRPVQYGIHVLDAPESTAPGRHACVLTEDGTGLASHLLPDLEDIARLGRIAQDLIDGVEPNPADYDLKVEVS